MRWIPIKIFFYWLAVRLTLRYPKLILQNGGKYKIKEWKGGNFYYITYWWKGGRFEDALDIIREFVNISLERGKNEQVLGRFLNDEEWQLGIIAKSNFNGTELKGYKIKKDYIPEGMYAVLLGRGYPEHIFAYWFWLKRRLKRDKYELDSPTFEFYNENTFSKILSDIDRIGEIRYKIKNK